MKTSYFPRLSTALLCALLSTATGCMSLVEQPARNYLCVQLGEEGARDELRALLSRCIHPKVREVEVDAETFTVKWLDATYVTESVTGASVRFSNVSRVDVYSDGTTLVYDNYGRHGFKAVFAEGDAQRYADLIMSLKAAGTNRPAPARR